MDTIIWSIEFTITLIAIDARDTLNTWGTLGSNTKEDIICKNLLQFY